MSTESLFAKTLGLSNPWEVSKVVFSPEEKRLDITIDFPRGSTFTCPVCGASGAKRYDSNEEQWHHLNFFRIHDISSRSCSASELSSGMWNEEG